MVAEVQAEQDQREAAEAKTCQEHLARPDVVGEIADRRLGQAGDQAEHRERKTELDIADAERLLEERQQHRQREDVKMAQKMRDRNRRQRAQCAIGLRMLRCSQNVGHIW